MGETDIEVGEGTPLLSQSWTGDVPLKDLKAATFKERAVAAAAIVGCTWATMRGLSGVLSPSLLLRCGSQDNVDPPLVGFVVASLERTTDAHFLSLFY